ncbi:tyrosyl-DNA phosphodiesterase domain-containing protein [Apiospora aurea]|uniref:Tyrosyl-DNA phosphodiesterase domain-containing protein n=1 Tax=Apiospora aurea TaxID=335848 RepID=A0ABR1QV15_9PEZI
MQTAQLELSPKGPFSMDANGGFEDDEAALRYAIALSLQDGAGAGQGNPSTSDDPIQLSSDDEDEDDLEKPPVYRPSHRLRQQDEMQGTKREEKREEVKPSSPAAQQQPAQPAQSGLAALGLDRKKMEEERLARLGKRKAPDSEQVSQDRNRRPKTVSASPGEAASAYHCAGGGCIPCVPLDRGPAVNESRPPVHAHVHASASSHLRRFALAKGRREEDMGRGLPTRRGPSQDRRNTPKGPATVGHHQLLDEAHVYRVRIQRSTGMSATIVTDAPSCFSRSHTPLSQRKEIEANAPNENVRFCFPTMLPMGSMHSKLQLLRFPNHLRIVVPSGNFVPYDWGRRGLRRMCEAPPTMPIPPACAAAASLTAVQVVFIIDLPKVQTPEAAAANKLTMFGEELCYFLTAQGLDKGLVTSLTKYDFSETSRYAFVHTMGSGGTHVDDGWKRTGYCGLGRAVSALGLNTPSLIDIDLVISSLGSVNHELLCALYYAAQGDDGQKVLRERTSKAKAKMAVAKHELSSAILDNHFRIYFPSHDTVAQSRGGPRSAGTICAQSKWWDSATFPRDLIYDYKNVRAGLLLHSKMMLVRGQDPHGAPAAWGYVGSANLSESAWGRLTSDKKTGKPKLSCRNWECGVVIPATEQGVGGVPANKTSPFDLSVFLGSIPVPIVATGHDNYGRTRSKRPWLFLGN